MQALSKADYGGYLKGITNKVKQYALNLSEIELKVEEATNNEPWGPHGTVMGGALPILQLCTNCCDPCKRLKMPFETAPSCTLHLSRLQIMHLPNILAAWLFLGGRMSFGPSAFALGGMMAKPGPVQTTVDMKKVCCCMTGLHHS